MPGTNVGRAGSALNLALFLREKGDWIKAGCDDFLYI